MWNYASSIFPNKIWRFQTLFLCIFCKVLTSIFCPLTLPQANSGGSRLWGLWGLWGLWRPQVLVGHVGNPLSGVSSAQNGTQNQCFRLFIRKNLSRILVYLLVWSAESQNESGWERPQWSHLQAGLSHSTWHWIASRWTSNKPSCVLSSACVTDWIKIAP